MKKLCLKIIILCACAFVLIGLLFYTAYFLMPSAFSDSYQKGFNYQYHTLENAPDEPKIIVLGGSYMAFATNSALLASLSGRPSYTLGIHSGMGMCYIIETAEKFINDGDIVVYSFRPFKKNDYGMGLTYLCFEGEKELFFDFFKAHPFVVIKTAALAIYTKLYNCFYQNLRYALLHKIGVEESVYSATAFDTTSGNLIFPRPSIDPNIPESEFEPRFKYDVKEIDPSCIEILNEFDDFCKKHDANLYITYSPAYLGSIASSDEEISEYETWLSEKLDAPIISAISENLLPKDCVYNGALHMNDKGAEAYTRQLYQDLCKALAF